MIGNKNSAMVVTIGGQDYTVKTVVESISGFWSDLVNGLMLVDGNPIRSGLRTVRGRTLPSGVTQFVEKIAVLSEKPASEATAKSDTLLMDAEFASAGIPNFKNGILKFNQNAELLRVAGSKVSPHGTPTCIDDILATVSPFLLRGGDGSPFDIQAELTGSTLVANFAFKLIWEALEFTPTNNA